MPIRQFTDSRGVTWDVWDVEPSYAERRVGPADRRRVPRGADRRQQPSAEPRPRVSGEYAQGWLAFESRFEKRRVAPVPDGWEQLDAAGLEELLGCARTVGKPRGLIE